MSRPAADIRNDIAGQLFAAVGNMPRQASPRAEPVQLRARRGAAPSKGAPAGHGAAA